MKRGRKVTDWLLGAAFALLLCFDGWGCNTTFETPASWGDRYAEIALENGLPDSVPEPGERPASFTCSLPQDSVGCLVVMGTDPEWTTVVTVDREGTWSLPATLRTPSSGVLSFDLIDGTDVYVYGDLIIYDGAYTRMSECQADVEIGVGRCLD